MLPYEPETMEEMKARFPEAIASVVDTEEIRKNPALTPGKYRKHVFDFPDGMRLIISVSRCRGIELLHMSASGSDRYAQSIRDEGLDGLVEDALLRLAALLGHAPGDMTPAYMTESGVLHMMFDWEGTNGPKRRDEGSGAGDVPAVQGRE